MGGLTTCAHRSATKVPPLLARAGARGQLTMWKWEENVVLCVTRVNTVVIRRLQKVSRVRMALHEVSCWRARGGTLCIASADGRSVARCESGGIERFHKKRLVDSSTDT